MPLLFYINYMDSAVRSSKQERNMSKFIGYTVGLQAVGEMHNGLVKVEFSESAGGGIEARLVSGNNLRHIRDAGNLTITREEYEDRPRDNIDQAAWAFDKFGYSIIGREQA